MRVLMLAPDNQMIDRRILQQARSLRETGHDVVLACGFECRTPGRSVVDGTPVHRFDYDWSDPRLTRLRQRLAPLLRRSELAQRVVNRAWTALARRVLTWSSFDRYVLDRAAELGEDPATWQPPTREGEAPAEPQTAAAPHALPGVVHVHDLPLLRHGRWLADRWGAKLVFDAHEVYHQQDVLPAKARRRLDREERRLVPTLDLWFTVNEPIAAWYENRLGRRPRVLLNAAPPPPEAPEPPKAHGFSRGQAAASLHQRADLPTQTRIVLFQGWLSAERNIETLVRAAEHLPTGTALVVIGYGGHEPALRAIADRLPDDRVRFLGQMSPAELATVTPGADLGVVPYLPIDVNHRLCSPNKFFEFVQTGVPVLAHNGLPFFEAMSRDHGVVLTCDMTDPASIAAAATAYLEDPAARERMRQACDRAAGLLNWDVEGAKLVAAYEELTRDG
jgi:glycosyltransferase involved in cell wall biosynthesis